MNARDKIDAAIREFAMEEYARGFNNASVEIEKKLRERYDNGFNDGRYESDSLHALERNTIEKIKQERYNEGFDAGSKTAATQYAEGYADGATEERRLERVSSHQSYRVGGNDLPGFGRRVNRSAHKEWITLPGGRVPHSPRASCGCAYCAACGRFSPLL